MGEECLSMPGLTEMNPSAKEEVSRIGYQFVFFKSQMRK